jgi:UDP-N-acetyl-D-galactosamine dehydrogenase
MVKEKCIAVVGLGYVGLPLVVEFGKTIRTVGYDIASEKVHICRAGKDPSKELLDSEMAQATMAVYSDEPSCLEAADYIIVAVPTPVDAAHRPDLTSLIAACQVVGKHMKNGAIVIFESTVYPGATEEVCIPEIERASGMLWKRDFFVGYSPERINPGDREHTLCSVIKVVSGDTETTLDEVAALYEHIVEPGVCRTSSIKTAEASKVIENTQRDLNIALMNELSIIFNKLGIDTGEVLSAAGTKWNFLDFKPGLVGGHCIGVDPYYLTHKAEMLGYHPQVILAGRRINDGMGKFIAEQTIKQLIANGDQIKGAKVNVLGLTFKENCSDIRNSKVIDIVNELKEYGLDVQVADPLASRDDAWNGHSLKLCEFDDLPKAQAIIVAVAHEDYINLQPDKIRSVIVDHGVIIDVKGAMNSALLIGMGFNIWRL